MKILILVLCTIGFNLNSIGQKPTCLSLHEGKFKVTTKESGTTFITRTVKTQIEENSSMGYIVVFDITWVDECTYELRPKELIKGDPVIMGNGKSVLKTRIKGISNKSYIAETSANFSDSILDFEVEIIK